MRRLWACLALVLLLLGLASPAVLAQVLPSPEGYLNDFAGLVSPSGRVSLEKRLVQLEKDTTAELAVVTIVSLEGDTEDDYASRLFEKWGIGKKDRDNGVLFLIAIVERKTRIEVGYGLEGIITDGRAGRILDNEVLPAFREGDYETGIVKGTEAIENYIRTGTPPSVLEDNPISSFFSKSDWFTTALLVLGIISIYILSFMARTKSIWLGGVWGAIMGLVLGFGWGNLAAVIGLPIGLGILGVLLDIIISRNYRKRSSGGHSTTWFGSYGGFSGGGGSSFGGFGGGHSGGGGASRGW